MSGVEGSARVATIYFTAVSSVVSQLRPKSLSGIMARYLGRVVPNGKVPIAVGKDSAAFAVGGVPLRRPESAFHWLFGENNDATSALCQFLKQSLDSPRICFHPSVKPTIKAHFPNGAIGTDHFFVSYERQEVELPKGAKIHEFASRPAHLEFNEEIEASLPPEAIWNECKFQYLGLEIDSRIESVVEYTVEDGEFCLLQQIRTSEAARKTGYARILVASLANAMHEESILPVLIVSSQNNPSIALAHSSGFDIVESFGVVEM